MPAQITAFPLEATPWNRSAARRAVAGSLRRRV